MDLPLGRVEVIQVPKVHLVQLVALLMRCDAREGSCLKEAERVVDAITAADAELVAAFGWSRDNGPTAPDAPTED
jgi:hypothetical protein